MAELEWEPSCSIVSQLAGICTLSSPHHGAGHGVMPGTKNMPDLDIILKVVIPSDPFTASFHFRNYVYIRLIVNELGMFGA